MAFPEYTKIRRYDREFAICPHCGQLMKTKYHDDGPDFEDYDEYHGSINSWYTCKCKNCKISGDGSNSKHYSLADQSAWKFPKGYEITATQKQNNYIAFLAGELQLYYNYIANKEVACEVIRQLLIAYNQKMQQKIYRQRIINCFDSFWNVYDTDECRNTIKLARTYRLKFSDIRISLSAEVNRDNPTEATFNYEINNITKLPTEEERRIITENIFQEFTTITNKLNKIQYPTEAEANRQIEADKQQFKKDCEYMREPDGDYDDYMYAPDFGDLC